MDTTHFSNAEFTEMFEEAIATTGEYVVDKKSWAAPFQATVEGRRRKKMEGGDL